MMYTTHHKLHNSHKKVLKFLFVVSLATTLLTSCTVPGSQVDGTPAGTIYYIRSDTHVTVAKIQKYVATHPNATHIERTLNSVVSNVEDIIIKGDSKHYTVIGQDWTLSTAPGDYYMYDSITKQYTTHGSYAKMSDFKIPLKQLAKRVILPNCKPQATCENIN